MFWTRHSRAEGDRCHPERRTSFRYPTTRNQVRLAWWEGDEARNTLGWIANLNTHGALLVLDRLPPPCPLVAFRLEWPIPSPWCQVQVMRVHGARQVGVLFCDGCPDEFRELIVSNAGAGNRHNTEWKVTKARD